MAELEKRMGRAEFSDPLEPGREYNRILEATLPKMAEGERASIRRTQLQAHQIGAEILAEHQKAELKTDTKALVVIERRILRWCPHCVLG